MRLPKRVLKPPSPPVVKNRLMEVLKRQIRKKITEVKPPVKIPETSNFVNGDPN